MKVCVRKVVVNGLKDGKWPIDSIDVMLRAPPGDEAEAFMTLPNVSKLMDIPRGSITNHPIIRPIRIETRDFISLAPTAHFYLPLSKLHHFKKLSIEKLRHFQDCLANSMVQNNIQWTCPTILPSTSTSPLSNPHEGVADALLSLSSNLVEKEDEESSSSAEVVSSPKRRTSSRSNRRTSSRSNRRTSSGSKRSKKKTFNSESEESKADEVTPIKKFKEDSSQEEGKMPLQFFENLQPLITMWTESAATFQWIDSQVMMALQKRKNQAEASVQEANVFFQSYLEAKKQRIDEETSMLKQFLGQ